jgi:hypothetical protein
MSRGFGKMQHAVLGVIRRHGKPMTFAEMCGVSDPFDPLSPSMVRSARRALHRLVDAEMLITIGEGGRAEPYRYFLHPMCIVFMGKTPEADALMAALQADEAASLAANIAMMKKMKGRAE